MRSRIVSLLLLAVAIAGCASEGPGTPAGTGGTPSGLCDSGQAYTYVVSLADVAKRDASERMAGFDLDGRVSDETDVTACGHADFTSPPPDSEPGVDNQLGVLAESLEGMFDISASLESAIQDGTMTLLVTVGAVDDLTNDDCVTVELALGYRADGATAPALGPDGRLAPGQEYDYRPLADATGEIVNGRVRTDAIDVEGRITIVDPPVPFAIRDGQLRFDITEGRVSRGVVGGSVAVDTLIAAVEAMRPDLSGLAAAVLESHADLEPAGSECTALSAGFVFDGVKAVRAAERPAN